MSQTTQIREKSRVEKVSLHSVSPGAILLACSPSKGQPLSPMRHYAVSVHRRSSCGVSLCGLMLKDPPHMELLAQTRMFEEKVMRNTRRQQGLQSNITAVPLTSTSGSTQTSGLNATRGNPAVSAKHHGNLSSQWEREMPDRHSLAISAESQDYNFLE